MIGVKDMGFALYCQAVMEQGENRDLGKDLADFDKIYIRHDDEKKGFDVGMSQNGNVISPLLFSDDHITDAIERLQTRSPEFYQAFCESVGDCASCVDEFDSQRWNEEADGMRKVANYILLCAWSANGMKLPFVRTEIYLSAMIPRRKPREMAGELWRKLERQGEDKFGHAGFHFMAEVLDMMEDLGEESQIHLLALMLAVLEGLEKEKEDWLPSPKAG